MSLIVYKKLNLSLCNCLHNIVGFNDLYIMPDEDPRVKVNSFEIIDNYNGNYILQRLEKILFML